MNPQESHTDAAEEHTRRKWELEGMLQPSGPTIFQVVQDAGTGGISHQATAAPVGGLCVGGVTTMHPAEPAEPENGHCLFLVNLSL